MTKKTTESPEDGPDFNAILNEIDDDSEAAGAALSELLDSVHFSAPVTAALDDDPESE